MILYFADRRFRILGSAGTKGEGLTVYNDLKTEEIDAGGANFKCYVGFDQESREEAENYTKPGNYLLRQNGNISEFYTIIESETDTKNQEVYLYAEEAGLDLLNEIALPYEADQAYPIAYYINLFAADSGFEVRINQISNLSRKLKWEGESTVTARLLSVATQFDHADISFFFKVENLTVVKKYIDIYKKRGRNNYVTLRLNRDIDRIKTKKSIANLATALYVTGGTPEGAEDPITLNGYEYDDGRFHLQGTWLKDRQANAVWSRYLSKSEEGTGTGHLMATFSYDTTDQKELLNRAISRLKELSQVEINYEIDISSIPDTVQIGDKVHIVDGPGKQYLSARVLRLETSASNGTAKATLGEYLIQSGGISQSVQSLARRFEYLEKIKTRYTWTAYADDTTGAGISLDPTGKACFGTADNRTKKEPDLSDPDVYTWVKFRGEDGYTQYLHIKYSDDGGVTFTADNGNTPGKWLGQYVDYYKPDSDNVADYTWKKIQGENGEKGEDGMNGTNGKGMYYVPLDIGEELDAGESTVIIKMSDLISVGGEHDFQIGELIIMNYSTMQGSNLVNGRAVCKIVSQSKSTYSAEFLYTFGQNGADAVSYKMLVNTAAVSRSINQTGKLYVPEQIQVSAFRQAGNSEMTPYHACFVIDYEYRSGFITLLETEGTTCTYPVSDQNGTVLAFRISMYSDPEHTTLLDQVLIPMVDSGKEGAQGEKGEPGTNGTDATAYKMLASASAVAKTASGTYKQSTITLQGRSQSGNSAFGSYACRFKIETTTGSNLSSASWTGRYTSSSNVSSYTYTIPAGITGIRCSMYLAGGTATLLDQVIIPVVQDGSDGTSGSTTRSPGIFYSSKTGGYAISGFSYGDIRIPTGTVPQAGDLILCYDGGLFSVNYVGNYIRAEYLTTI